MEMETRSILMFGLQALMWFGILFALLYLIKRRHKIKKDEDFEQRDN